MRLASLGPALLAAFTLAVACAQEPAVTQDIVSAIPWPDQERAEYVLLAPDSLEEEGRGVLAVARQGGRFELRLRFENEEASDESVVLVDGVTLRPVSVRREFRGEKTRVIEGEYDAEEGTVQITETSDGDERQVPLRLKEHYYDNESSLFLWRTVAFSEGYEASYYAALTNQNTQQVVTLEVVGIEEVTVPAGTFQAWRVEIRAAGVKQVAWYADTPERPLVQYDNSRQLFQLTGVVEP